VVFRSWTLNCRCVLGAMAFHLDQRTKGLTAPLPTFIAHDSALISKRLWRQELGRDRHVATGVELRQLLEVSGRLDLDSCRSLETTLSSHNPF
jgi:hypothetical protein